MTRLYLLTLIAFLMNVVYAVEPLIDEYQLKAVTAHEEKNRECDNITDTDKKIKCLYSLSDGNNLYPLPLRGTERYCKEQYSTLSVDELEAEFKKIEAVYEQARFFPVGSAIEPERGEVTKGDLNSEIRCISDFIELKN